VLKFFDCDVGVGASGLGYRPAATPEELLAQMDRYGIERAIVYDRGAHEAGGFDRFDFVLNFCRASPRLTPAVPILPPACGEQPPPKELVSMILAAGVKAVRACPTAHEFTFEPFSMGPLLERLQEHRIPVLHSSQNVQDHPWEHCPDWRGLAETAAAFPDLPIVVLYTGMLQGRRLLPLMERCPNVLADLTCASFQFIEHVVARHGAGRLVFASHLPTEDPGLYTVPVLYSGIDPADRQRIAGDNIRRLVEAVR